MMGNILPDMIKNVTGGPGGDAYLILGRDSSVLYDCGMACFNRELIANIEALIGNRPLDYVVLSHSHYDHMGALPYVIKRWPEVVVCGAEKAKHVFASSGAVETILSMGRTAALHYGCDPEEITTEGLRIDRILKSGEVIDIGDAVILAVETTGHTDCCMSYLIRPQGILLASESTGIMGRNGKVRPSILKSFEQSEESADILRLLPYKYIIIPHYGLLDEKLNDVYFDMYLKSAQDEKKLIQQCIYKGLDEDEILKEHKKVYWNEERSKAQPYRAYEMNTRIIIRRMKEECKD